MNEIVKEFRELVNTSVIYQGKRMVITDVGIKNGRISVFTDSRTFVLFENDARTMLSQLEVVGDDIEVVGIVSSPVGHVLMGYENNADKVTEALMKQLDVLSSSSEVASMQLEKAKAISQLANTLVNVEKVKLGYLDLMNK
ncbi:hypothetical protein [Myroides odoratimimus]|uniref:hypothetical protein n=1 Tax=Myroides odoratimimus TaxID=76832 RepID=UPI0025771A11|nr:hypothetical protein [Myroides odoratimimus]MDM1452199.1 hypothetical protein [Myroides odoratimimus]MDM1475462.1 hypothetical protein [Myroides odoratimimus]MDM1488251.1 hypothetical protein [Myroides odoratimimus]